MLSRAIETQSGSCPGRRDWDSGVQGFEQVHGIPSVETRDLSAANFRKAVGGGIDDRPGFVVLPLIMEAILIHLLSSAFRGVKSGRAF